jgi:hypothetical protein
MVRLSVPCTIVRTHTLSYSKDTCGTYITSAGSIYVVRTHACVALSGSARARAGTALRHRRDASTSRLDSEVEP